MSTYSTRDDTRTHAQRATDSAFIAVSAVIVTALWGAAIYAAWGMYN